MLTPTLADDYNKIFRNFITELRSDALDFEEIHTGLTFIDLLIENTELTLSPTERFPMYELYALAEAWHEKREELEDYQEHWNSTHAHMLLTVFNAMLEGYIFELAKQEPNILFLDWCLDHLNVLSCQCGSEPERLLACIPSRKQARAFREARVVEGLDTPKDVQYLLDWFAEDEPYLHGHSMVAILKSASEREADLH
jgi:hypothetical protein